MRLGLGKEIPMRMLIQARLLTRPPLADISPPTSPRTRLFPSEAAVVFAHLQKGSMAALFWAESGHGLFSLLYCARKEIIAMKEQLTAVFQQVRKTAAASLEVGASYGNEAGLAD